jgi:hypothetical protein
MSLINSDCTELKDDPEEITYFRKSYLGLGLNQNIESFNLTIQDCLKSCLSLSRTVKN